MKFYIAEMAGIDKAISYSKKYKTGIEVQRFCNAIALDNTELEKKIKKTESELIENSDLALHGPYSELVPASIDKRIINVALYRFNQTYSIAQKLKAKHLILHSGFIPKTYPDEMWVENSVKFWKLFLYDKSDSIKIHIENVYENNYFNLKSLIEKINLSFVDICLDIGHVNSSSELTIRNWIEGLTDKIGYIHLHNNFGKYDNHFGLHNGSINMTEVFELIDKFCPKSIRTLETLEIDLTINWLLENKII